MSQHLVNENSKYILDLFSEQTIDSQSLESICIQVQKKFPKTENFNLCLLLSSLIAGGDLSLPGQRIVALALLFDIYKTVNNPFSPLFVHLLDGKQGLQSLAPQERVFIAQMHGFLPVNIKDILKRSAKQIMMTDVGPKDLEFDYTTLQGSVFELVGDMTSMARATASALVPLSNGSPPNRLALKELLEGLMSNEFMSLHSTLKAVGPIPPPPFLIETKEIPYSDEAVWKNLVNRGTYIPMYDSDYEGLIGIKPEKLERKVQNNQAQHKPKEDKKDKSEDKKSEEKEVSVVAEAQELTQLALKSALGVQHQQRLLALLDQNPNIVYEMGVTPTQLSIVMTALDLMVHLIQKTVRLLLSSRPGRSSYFTALGMHLAAPILDFQEILQLCTNNI